MYKYKTKFKIIKEQEKFYVLEDIKGNFYKLQKRFKKLKVGDLISLINSNYAFIKRGSLTYIVSVKKDIGYVFKNSNARLSDDLKVIYISEVFKNDNLFKSSIYELNKRGIRIVIS